MKLTLNAAIGVCEGALELGLLVSRIEGGIWRNPGFESQGDCIWDGMDPPISKADAARNNLAARDFLKAGCLQCDVFLITTSPIQRDHR